VTIFIDSGTTGRKEKKEVYEGFFVSFSSDCLSSSLVTRHIKIEFS
jgi:hypothetical protein